MPEVTDPRIRGLLKTRAGALAQPVPDVSVARACTFELACLGYHDPVPESPMENTAAAPLPEKRTTRPTASPTTRKKRTR